MEKPADTTVREALQLAHELNNLLTALLGYAELALGELGPADSARADVQEVRAVALRAAELMPRLLAACRKLASPGPGIEPKR